MINLLSRDVRLLIDGAWFTGLESIQVHDSYAYVYLTEEGRDRPFFTNDAYDLTLTVDGGVLRLSCALHAVTPDENLILVVFNDVAGSGPPPSEDAGV